MIRYTVEVTRSLAERDDVEVHVQCRPATLPFVVDHLGIPASRVVATPKGSVLADSIAELWGMRGVIEERGIDVVFGSKHLVPLSPIRARRVLTIHDLILFDKPGEYGRAKRALLPLAYRASINRAELLACVSHATSARLAALFPAAADRSTVVANAMTQGLLTAVPEPVPSLVGRRFALVVGDLSPRKNVGHVLRLWPEVARCVPGAQLVLVGPPGWGRLGELPGLEKLRQDGAVSLLGRVTDGALRWCYEQARVTLCPSRLEGFGLPALEASAFGCPLVVSDDPALAEAAGPTGTVVPLSRPVAWVNTIVSQLHAERVPSVRPAVRTWDDVARDLVIAECRGPGQGRGATGQGPCHR